MNITLSDLLKKMLDMSGSDLHITTNSPPQVRVHGHLQPLDMPPLTPSETKQLSYSVLTDAQKHRFEETLELDFSFGLKGRAVTATPLLSKRRGPLRPHLYSRAPGGEARAPGKRTQPFQSEGEVQFQRL